MPIYEYRCEACGHKMELLQKIADEPLLQCLSCGEEQLRKVISAAGFRLKGKGWYETDFKSGNKRNLAASNDIPKEKGDSGKTKDSQGDSTTNSKPKGTTSVADTS
jgi:putative FmdB family regulatory protein